jgi:hypothetical protein
MVCPSEAKAAMLDRFLLVAGAGPAIGDSRMGRGSW